MSVKTIYTCERCKKDQESETLFYTVGILVESGAQQFSEPSYRNKRCVLDKYMQVCSDCLDALGISLWAPTPKPDRPAPPSVEDLIRVIVQDEIANQ